MAEPAVEKTSKWGKEQNLGRSGDLHAKRLLEKAILAAYMRRIWKIR
jgi:hypothetical protein